MGVDLFTETLRWCIWIGMALAIIIVTFWGVGLWLSRRRERHTWWNGGPQPVKDDRERPW